MNCLKQNWNAIESAGCTPTVAEDFCAGKDPRNQTVCCNYCCPQGVTERYNHSGQSALLRQIVIKDLFNWNRYYMDHPEDYHKHPAMFLGQVSHDDNEADGCAAQCERP